MKKTKGKFGIILIALGCLCIFAAAGLTLYNLYDDARATNELMEENEKLREVVLSSNRPSGQGSGGQHAVPGPHNGGETDTDDTDENPPVYTDMPVLNIDGVDYVAMLSIPELGLEFAVRNEWSYPGLKKSPCRYFGSAYTNDLVICAHNYSTHFGRLNELEEGAEVLLVDMNGVVFTYSVALTEQLGPFETAPMLDSGFELTLFTCTVGGKSRVTVRCRLESMTVPQY